METVTFKLQEDIISEVDALLKPMRYNNRTEFIREAIREKLDRADKERRIANLLKLKGSLRTKTTDTELHKIREEAVRDIIRKNDWKLD